MEDAPVVPEVVAVEESVVAVVAEEPVAAPAVVVEESAPATAPVPVVEEPVGVPPSEDVSNVVAPKLVHQEVEAVVHYGPLDFKLQISNASLKHLQQVGELSFTLTDAKQSEIVSYLIKTYLEETVQVSEDKTVITVGDEYRIAMLVQDESPYILLQCLDDTNDHTEQYALNFALHTLLTK